MADLADSISQIYALESALLRARKMAEGRKSTAEVAAAMTGLLADESMGLVEQAARRVLAACSEGDMLRTQLAILRRLARFTPGTPSRKAEPLPRPQLPWSDTQSNLHSRRPAASAKPPGQNQRAACLQRSSFTLKSLNSIRYPSDSRPI